LTARTPEARVKAKVDRLLSQMGVWFFSPQSGIYGRAGIPDRIACVDGLFVGIEVKADKTKKPTKLQLDCMAKIESSGGRCFVVYDDESLEEVRTYITEVLGVSSRAGKSSGPKAE
jgi:hypothetical protein